MLGKHNGLNFILCLCSIIRYLCGVFFVIFYLFFFHYFLSMGMLRVMVFNATFKNISIISWRSVLLLEETGENHRSTASP